MAERPSPSRSIVVGTAGHIDHGKTTLLRALTGIDADRLPEEQRRGMTIDVGYAHLELPGGTVLDLVDVPGHDRLVGNMLVGAGEVDAALLVVAADDGPNAQTLEHLELLDALGIRRGLAVVTKVDVVDDARRAAVAADVTALLERTSLAGSPVAVASAVTREGIDAVREGLAALAADVEADGRSDAGNRGPRLPIDRAFAVKGRGTVVTGTLRGGRIRAGDVLRLVPGTGEVRVREVQVRGTRVDEAGGGRTALLVSGTAVAALERGAVLAAGDRVASTSRLLVALRPPAHLDLRRPAPAVAGDRDRVRLHLGTDQVDALVVRGPREAIDLRGGATLAILRLARPIAAAAGDRFALRRPSPGSTAAGGVVLDASPPRGLSRRRLDVARATSLSAAVTAGDRPAAAEARLAIHGAIFESGAVHLAADVADALREAAVRRVGAHHAAEPESAGLPLPVLRAALAREARRTATLHRAAAETVATAVVDRAIAAGVLARDGDRVRDPSRGAGLQPDVLAAMDRLEARLAVAAPPALSAAARDAGCPPDGVRALEAAGRIVRLEDDLAWAAASYRDLVRRALALAATAPLSPAAFRDATGTSRRYVLVILEDLDRRGLLRRTDAGHVLGPATIARLKARAAAAADPT